ncbi:MAG: NYN domain-containing protein [Actinobacteria bacterium]|nr:MAG: NYN domain-containing protein [Actinomycetota bacterium]
MLYLVDGYNVTKGDPATAGLPLEAQRNELVSRLCASAGTLLGPGQVVVVFDALGGTGGGDERAGAVRVTYALNCKADDEIVALATRHRGAVTVVTDDGGIARRTRGDLGARVKVVPSSVCFAEAVARAVKARAPQITRDVGLPSDANDITEWYKKQLDEGE